MKPYGETLRRGADQRVLAAEIFAAVAEEQAAAVGHAQVRIAAVGDLDLLIQKLANHTFQQINVLLEINLMLMQDWQQINRNC